MTKRETRHPSPPGTPKMGMVAKLAGADGMQVADEKQTMMNWHDDVKEGPGHLPGVNKNWTDFR